MTEYSVEQVINNLEKAFRPEKAGGTDADVQFKLTGEEAGEWIISIHDGKCSVSKGVHPNPKLAVIADGYEFRDVLLGKMDGMMAFMQGKLQIDGDLNLATKLLTFFKLKMG